MRSIHIFLMSFFLLPHARSAGDPTGDGVTLGDTTAMFTITLQKVSTDNEKTVVDVLHMSNDEVMTHRFADPAKNTYLIDNTGVVYPWRFQVSIATIR